MYISLVQLSYVYLFSPHLIYKSKNYSHITLTQNKTTLQYTCKSHIYKLIYSYKSLVYFYLSVQYSEGSTGLLHKYDRLYQEGTLLGNVPLV